MKGYEAIGTAGVALLIAAIAFLAVGRPDVSFASGFIGLVLMFVAGVIHDSL